MQDTVNNVTFKSLGRGIDERRRVGFQEIGCGWRKGNGGEEGSQKGKKGAGYRMEDGKDDGGRVGWPSNVKDLGILVYIGLE